MTVFELYYLYKVARVEGPDVLADDRTLRRGDVLVTKVDHAATWIHRTGETKITAFFHGRALYPEGGSGE